MLVYDESVDGISLIAVKCKFFIYTLQKVKSDYALLTSTFEFRILSVKHSFIKIF